MRMENEKKKKNGWKQERRVNMKIETKKPVNINIYIY